MIELRPPTDLATNYPNEHGKKELTLVAYNFMTSSLVQFAE